MNYFNLLGWVLAAVMFLFFALIVVPGAKGEETETRAELVLKIRDEKLRIWEYETSKMICNIAVVDVKMIGSQVSLTCFPKERKIIHEFSIQPTAPRSDR